MSTAKNDVQMDGSLIHEHFADHLSVKIVTAKSKESVAVDSISPHSLQFFSTNRVWALDWNGLASNLTLALKKREDTFKENSASSCIDFDSFIWGLWENFV